jgi:hypothetical protein
VGGTRGSGDVGNRRRPKPLLGKEAQRGIDQLGATLVSLTSASGLRRHMQTISLTD